MQIKGKEVEICIGSSNGVNKKFFFFYVENKRKLCFGYDCIFNSLEDFQKAATNSDKYTKEECKLLEELIPT